MKRGQIDGLFTHCHDVHVNPKLLYVLLEMIDSFGGMNVEPRVEPRAPRTGLSVKHVASKFNISTSMVPVHTGTYR